MVLGKTHPCFDYHKFFRTYPEAFKQIYRLRDFMKYRIVEWDKKDPSDPIKRMELGLNTEKKQAISTQEQTERPVNEQQGNSIEAPMDISSFENRAAVTEVKMDRIQIEPLIPENNRKRNFHASENESEEEENGLLGRICKKVKSAFTK